MSAGSQVSHRHCIRKTMPCEPGARSAGEYRYLHQYRDRFPAWRPAFNQKTSFAPSGATVADVRLLRQNLSPHVQLKAAGGVRNLHAILAMIDLSCTRCGATATAEILDEFQKRSIAGQNFEKFKASD